MSALSLVELAKVAVATILFTGAGAGMIALAFGATPVLALPGVVG